MSAAKLAAELATATAARRRAPSEDLAAVAWEPDKHAKHCPCCARPFKLRRKHHCRACVSRGRRAEALRAGACVSRDGERRR